MKIGVTGHRQLKGTVANVAQSVKEKLQELIQGQDEVLVHTGMALGFDQLVCDVCLDLGISYKAVVPCDGQDALWNDAQKARYADLLSKASSVLVVNPGPYEAWKMHARNGWIVDNSEVMVVHWDGMYTGGAGQCMKLVSRKKLPYHNTVTKKW